MTYWMLNLVFLSGVAVVVIASMIARRSPTWRAVGLAAIPLLLLTAIFDNILVGTGIVGYDLALISGAKIGVAPLEDFAYAIAALVLLPSLWSLLSPRPRPRPRPRPLPVSSTAPSKRAAADESGSAREDGTE